MMTENINVLQLRDWLSERGFRFENNRLRDQMNDCDWYAWRRTKLNVRDCECNGPNMQIVLTPQSFNHGGGRWVSVDVDVTGEYSGVWYKLQAYRMAPDKLVARLDEIETALMRAWNSLMPTWS